MSLKNILVKLLRDLKLNNIHIWQVSTQISCGNTCEQNGHCFANNIFKFIFLEKKFYTLLKCH